MITAQIEGGPTLEFPDGTSQEVIQKTVRRVAGEADMRRMADPVAGMSGFEKARAGFGKAFSDIGQGIAQNVGLASREDVKETRKRDAPLMNQGPAVAGNVLGSAAALVPTLAIPGVNTVGGAALLGAGTGAIMPSESTGETALNVGGGALLSGAAQKLVNVLTKPVSSNLTAEQARLAQVAANEGIPLTATQQTGNKALRIIDAGFENIPSTAGAQAATRQAQQSAFNKAVLSRAGITGEEATPQVLATQKSTLGKQFEDIAGRNTLAFDNTLVNDIATVVDNAGRRLTPDKAGTVGRAVDDMLTQLNSQGAMLGTNYQGWRTELGRLSRSNDDQGYYFGELKKALDKSFNRQISGADSDAWKQASREYANLKTIMNAVGGPGINPASGNIQPAQLSRALASSVGREGKALGRGDLNELSRVGQTFLADKVPDSGTPQRLLAQALLTGGAGGAITGDPMEALTYGAAGLALPRAIQAALMSKPGQRALTQGLITNPKVVKALRVAPQAGALLNQ